MTGARPDDQTAAPWPWDDRGRSKLTLQQIEEQSQVALFLYRQAMGEDADRTG